MIHLALWIASFIFLGGIALTCGALLFVGIYYVVDRKRYWISHPATYDEIEPRSH